MRINPISVTNVRTLNRTNNNATKTEFLRKENSANEPKQIAFKASHGKIIGGLFGGAVAGLAFVLSAGTVGLVAAGAFVASEIGGAVIGALIGDAATGKDKKD